MTFKELRRTSAYGHSDPTINSSLKGRIEAVEESLANTQCPTTAKNLKRDLKRLKASYKKISRKPHFEEDYEIQQWDDSEILDTYQLLDI